MQPSYKSAYKISVGVISIGLVWLIFTIGLDISFRFRPTSISTVPLYLVGVLLIISGLLVVLITAIDQASKSKKK